MREIEIRPGDTLKVIARAAPQCSVCTGPIEYRLLEDDKPRFSCGATPVPRTSAVPPERNFLVGIYDPMTGVCVVQEQTEVQGDRPAAKSGGV